MLPHAQGRRHRDEIGTHHLISRVFLKKRTKTPFFYFLPPFNIPERVSSCIHNPGGGGGTIRATLSFLPPFPPRNRASIVHIFRGEEGGK